MPAFDFTLSRRGDELLVALNGALNAPNSLELAAAQDKEFLEPEVKNVSWNVSGVKLIASAGLRVMMTTIKRSMRQGGKIRVIAASQGVLQVFRISGLDNYITVCKTTD